MQIPDPPRRTVPLSVTVGQTVTAQVPVDRVLDQLTDDELIEVIEKRGFTVYDGKTPAGSTMERQRAEYLDLADELRLTMQQRDRLHLEVLLIRLQTLMGVARVRIPHPHKDPL